MSVEYTIRHYSETTLLGILRDLRKNPMSRRQGTWEQKRLVAVEEEAKRRKQDGGGK